MVTIFPASKRSEAWQKNKADNSHTGVWSGNNINMVKLLYDGSNRCIFDESFGTIELNGEIVSQHLF